MTALAEALLAAQRSAIGALSKAYVAGTFEDDDLLDRLDRIGATDAVDQKLLVEALEVLKDYGATAPQPNGAIASRKVPEPPSPDQLGLIKRLAKERNWQPPDVVNSKLEASEIIDAMKDGSYDVARYARPF